MPEITARTAFLMGVLAGFNLGGIGAFVCLLVATSRMTRRGRE